MRVGRRRTKHKNLPARLHLKRGRYYYGRNQEFVGDNLADALRVWAEKEAAKTGDRPRAFRELAGEYAKRVFKDKAIRTRKDNAAELAQLLKVFATAPLDQIRPEHLSGYLERRDAKTRGNREVALFSAIWNWGRSKGLTALSNPCLGVKRNKERGRDKLVSPEELAAEYAVASQPLRDALDLYNILGVRVSELLRARLTDIRSGILHVKQQKTGTVLRFVIEGELEAVLGRIQARSYAVTSLALIRDEHGQPMTYSALHQRHKRAAVRAGVKFQLRDLRGKHATERADAQGMRAAQKAMGHSTMAMTERYVKARAGEKVSPLLRTDSGIADKGSA